MGGKGDLTAVVTLLFNCWNAGEELFARSCVKFCSNLNFTLNFRPVDPETVEASAEGVVGGGEVTLACGEVGLTGGKVVLAGSNVTLAGSEVA